MITKIIIVAVLVVGAITGIIMSIRKNEEEAFQCWYKNKFVQHCFINNMTQEDIDKFSVDFIRSIYTFEHDPEKVLKYLK